MNAGPDSDGITLSLDENVRRLLRVGAVAISPVQIGPSSVDLLQELDELGSDLAGKWAGQAPAEIDALKPARELYKSFGIDPTKTRPSSEALLRRVLRSKPLPRIMNAVDLCNLLSLSFLLPLGLYDSAKIVGEVTLRRGGEGEAYPGIRKETVHLHGRPVLSDRRGAFGNPTSDSLRTAVDEETRALWLVIFAPRSIARGTMQEHVRAAGEGMKHHLTAVSEQAGWTGLVMD
jgi:DNA/RNA-binding domain of Phe-tRNA-synthetase-like protein